MESAQLRKMFFIYRALDAGWRVKKRNGIYVFSKKHDNQKKYFREEYLAKFIAKYDNNNNNSSIF